MAFELITGHAGRNHVDSADMGEAFAGIVGKGRYILDTGDGMACSMADSNTLTVGKGSMIMDGRIVRNETAATFKIANGTQGQYRHDLACLRYKIDRSDDSIESVEQVVLQGTPATTESEAKDPEYEAGDILSGDLSATVPIARVKLDNITPTCEVMLDSVTSLKSLGDSVPQVVLFDNKNIGFKDTITLSQDPANFARVKFTCKTDDNAQFTVDYVPGLGTTRFIASCAHINLNSPQVFLKTRTYDVVGRTVNTAYDTVGGKQNWHSGQVSIPGGSFTTNDVIRIVRAVGYMS